MKGFGSFPALDPDSGLVFVARDRVERALRQSSIREMGELARDEVPPRGTHGRGGRVSARSLGAREPLRNRLGLVGREVVEHDADRKVAGSVQVDEAQGVECPF